MPRLSQSHGVLEILIISLMYIGRGSAGDDSPRGTSPDPRRHVYQSCASGQWLI